jgi:hypothetical protein
MSAEATRSLPPTHDEIAERAHEITARRGGAHGHERVDWKQAERELRLERGLPAAKNERGEA